MLVSILSNGLWALNERYLAGVSPAIQKALLEGREIELRKPHKLKALQNDLTDEEGNMIPFMAASGLVADTQTGKSRANSKAYNIQVIPLRGVLTKDGGLCSYGMYDIRSWIADANANPNIDAMVLFADGPGSTVDGIENLASDIYYSAKPIVGFVDGSAFSGTYWAISQTKTIIINSLTTAYVGSIGVLAQLVNQSKALEMAGYAVQIIRDNTSPNKALINSIEPLTEEAKASLDADLATVKQTFKSDVQRGRGGRLSNSVSLFDGTELNGKAAIKEGLVDKVGTLEDAINEAAKLAAKQTSNSNSKNAQNDMKMNLLTMSAVAAAMGITAAAGETEAEVTEAHLTALNAFLGTQATALTTAEAALVTANADLATANTSLQTVSQEVAGLKTENGTLKTWKTNAEATGNPKGDLSNGGGEGAKKLSKISEEGRKRNGEEIK